MRRKISDLLLLDDGEVYLYLSSWELTRQFIIDAKEEYCSFYCDPLFADICDTGVYRIEDDVIDGGSITMNYMGALEDADLESNKGKYYLIDYKDYLDGCDVKKCAHNIFKRSLSAGEFCVLVYSSSLKNFYASPFYEELRKLGFLSWGKRSFWSCDWAYINLVDKVYTLGRPVEEQQSRPLGNHAVTISEFWTIYHIFEKYGIKADRKYKFIDDWHGFKTIYEIFEKYKGKDLFVFDKEPFDAPE